MTQIRIVITCLFLVGLCGRAAPQELRDVYRRVRDAVVTIHTEERETSVDAWGTTFEGQGSGVLVSRDGKVMTAAHVIQAVDALSVEFLDGQIIPARVLASIPAFDIAMVQLQTMPENAKIAKLGNSDLVESGDQVFVVGAPFGISHSLTVGYISARRTAEIFSNLMTKVEVFQTDAAINVGNSGGPLFNMNGEVIGIVSYIVSQSGEFAGLGFAVTSKVAKELLESRDTFWTGLEGYAVAGDLAKTLNLPQATGYLVQRIAKGSPAEKLGLRAGTVQAVIEEEEMLLGGDIILKVGDIGLGTDFRGLGEIRGYLNKLQHGETWSVTVLRAGQVIKLSTKVKREAMN